MFHLLFLFLKKKSTLMKQGARLSFQKNHKNIPKEETQGPAGWETDCYKQECINKDNGNL